MLLICPYPSWFLHRNWGNWPNALIPECACFITHNAPFRTEMCIFLFWMEHRGIWNRYILGFLKLVFYMIGQWVLSNPEGYGWISRFLTKTKHDTTKTVCMIIWIYFTHVQPELVLILVMGNLRGIKKYWKRNMMKWYNTSWWIQTRFTLCCVLLWQFTRQLFPYSSGGLILVFVKQTWRIW